MALDYAVLLTPDDNGTLLVTCPDLPEVTTSGGDKSDALQHARDAIEEAIAARIAARADIPLPSTPRGRQKGKAVSKGAATVARVVLPEALRYAEFAAQPPLVRGDELARELGIRPGPGLGALLAQLEEARFAGEIGSRDEAIALARTLV